jgi:hypothetical protein
MTWPLIQIAASVPATPRFPVVLFSVIADAMTIASDLKEATEVVRMRDGNTGENSSYSMFSRTLSVAYRRHHSQHSRTPKKP